MRTNTAIKSDLKTHEGAPAKVINPLQRLRRSVLSCLLFEDEFYEDGQSIADRIKEAAALVPVETIAALAVEARHEQHLRHVPLLLLTILTERARGNPLVAATIAKVISRADEIGELVALYWASGKRPLAAQLKKGLAKAFAKFDAYGLAKYDRDAKVKLSDVIRMVRPKPANDEQAKLFGGVRRRDLAVPDTWEVALSSGADKKETFERLLREGKLGYLALLRNLRNMAQANVDGGMIREAILARKGAGNVLPFRYIAAARAVPQFEPWLDEALVASISGSPILPGKTAVLVDVSSSMNARLSGKSDLTRVDAAAALAAIIAGDIRMFSFSDDVIECPPRRGMAGVDAIQKSQTHNGTRLFDAVAAVNAQVPYDRLIVFTDEQATAPDAYYRGMIQGAANVMPDPKAKGYLINVASAQNGVGYGKWVHIDGWSEAVLKFIAANEAAPQ